MLTHTEVTQGVSFLRQNKKRNNKKPKTQLLCWKHTLSMVFISDVDHIGVSGMVFNVFLNEV